MNLFHTRKKTKLRIKIITLSVTTCMVSLLICGITIFLTYAASSSAKIKNDVIFFLDETTNNFSDKVTLLEDILLTVRNSNDIMFYLTSLYHTGASSYDKYAIQSQFKKCVDLYSDKNTGGFSFPFVANVYLFLNSPNFSNYICKSSYNSFLREDELALDRDINDIYHSFLDTGQDIFYFQNEGKLRLAATLYDSNFNALGTIIYDINLQAMNEIMDKTNHYEDSFWFVFDKGKHILTNNEEFSLSPADSDAISRRFDSDAYQYDGDTSSYLARTQHFGMGLGVAAGIPRNYINRMLYSSIRVYFYMLLILAPLIFLFTFFFIYRLTKPLKTVEEKIKLVEQGEFDTKLPDFNSAEFSNISNVFNAMTDRIHYLINDVYAKQIIIKESELQFLQAQMNPHFMFNVLNAIAIQAKLDGNEKVYQMIHSFSLLTQAKIYKTGNEKIRVHEELEYVDFYLQLQKCRFDDKLTYDIHFEKEDLYDRFIPKLSIQPIVENSMIHGIEPNHMGGHIQVNIYEVESLLCIDVIDNGIGFSEPLDHIAPAELKHSPDAAHTHIALLNIHKIIQHFYGYTYGVSITSIPTEGTTVSVILPIDEGEQHV